MKFRPFKINNDFEMRTLLITMVLMMLMLFMMVLMIMLIIMMVLMMVMMMLNKLKKSYVKFRGIGVIKRIRSNCFDEYIIGPSSVVPHNSTPVSLKS